MFLTGKFTKKEQQENQEQDVRTLSRWKGYRSKEYEVGGDELGTKKNGGAF
jgi:hypothetical protein